MSFLLPTPSFFIDQPVRPTTRQTRLIFHTPSSACSSSHWTGSHLTAEPGSPVPAPSRHSMCCYNLLPFDGRINKERRICDPYKQIYEYQMNRENMNLSASFVVPSLGIMFSIPPICTGSHQAKRIHFLFAISSERLQLICKCDDLQ